MSTTNLVSTVKETVSHLDKIRSLQDLNTTFKTLCCDLLKMGHEINKEIVLSSHTDQCSKRMWHSVEKIISNLIIIQLCLPMFRKLMQHYVCNSLNPLAKGGRVFVIRQINFLLNDISDSLRNCENKFKNVKKEEETEDKEEEPGMFVKTVDNILEIVALKPDAMNLLAIKQQLNKDINKLLSFSTEVAHLSRLEQQQNLILKHCEEVLKAEREIQEWKAETSPTTTASNTTEHNEELLQHLSEKIEMLELKVNIGILEQMVDTFVQPTRKLKTLFDAIINHKSPEDISKHLKEFHEYFDNVCQVCFFAFAFANDVNRARRIKALLRVLEYADLEISLIATSSSKDNLRPLDNSPTINPYFQLIYTSWIQYMTKLVKNMDEITEPVSFLSVTINKMKEALNAINCILKGTQTKDEDDIVKTYNVIKGHTTRTLKILENTNEEMDLVTETQQLKTAHSATEKTFENLQMDLDNCEKQRRFLKHCSITIACVQKALNEVKIRKQQPTEDYDEDQKQSKVAEELTGLTISRRIESNRRRNSFRNTTIEGFQGLSFGLTEILENLTTEAQLSNTTIDKTLTEMVNSETKMAVNLRSSDYEEVDDDDDEDCFVDFGSQLVNTMQRLRDLEDIQHKMEDIAASKTS